MTVAATVYLGRGKKGMRQRGRVVRGGVGWERGTDWLAVSWGCVFACRERSREGTGVTRCEGKALSSAPGP